MERKCCTMTRENGIVMREDVDDRRLVVIAVTGEREVDSNIISSW